MRVSSSVFPRNRTRRSLALLAALGAVSVAGCTEASSAAAGAVDEPPTYGGTLKAMGLSDVDHMSPTSAYITHSLGLMRMTTRQLVSHRAVADFDEQTVIVADLATAVPSRDNGGISADGRTYTFHIRQGARWNTKPARQITAADEVRGIKMLCNPVSPTGAPGYYETTIHGLTPFCDAFAKVPGTVEGIQRFLATHDVPGVQAVDDSTVVFHLDRPASDFLELIALPFATPMAVEELRYLPDGPEYRAHTVASGPYQIVNYIPNHGISLSRNPAWDPATDPIRKAYVDSVQIIEGVDAESTQQQIEAGIADMGWGSNPSAVALASLVPMHDPNLVIGPPGENFSLTTHLAVNMIGSKPLKKLAVRQALEYAVDRVAITQIYGGAIVSKPLVQAVVNGAGGYRPGYDPYPSPDNRGDPEKARQLLAGAGYPDGVTLKLLYMTSGPGPRIAQSLQASAARAGIRLELLPATASDFYAKYLGSPDNARRGVWDLATARWAPDWYGGANGRTVIQPLFDGRNFGPNTNNYGDYDNPLVNAAIDSALAALTPEAAVKGWEKAATIIMEDAGDIPLVQNKLPIYHSSRLQNCIYLLLGSDCDMSNVWLHGVKGARPQFAKAPARAAGQSGAQ
jgi:peptide/nickel transport system substrate-binding protein